MFDALIETYINKNIFINLILKLSLINNFMIHPIHLPKPTDKMIIINKFILKRKINLFN